MVERACVLLDHLSELLVVYCFTHTDGRGCGTKFEGSNAVFEDKVQESPSTIGGFYTVSQRHRCHPSDDRVSGSDLSSA
jgi:hypothetical protein